VVGERGGPRVAKADTIPPTLPVVACRGERMTTYPLCPLHRMLVVCGGTFQAQERSLGPAPPVHVQQVAMDRLVSAECDDRGLGSTLDLACTVALTFCISGVMLIRRSQDFLTSSFQQTVMLTPAMGVVVEPARHYVARCTWPPAGAYRSPGRHLRLLDGWKQSYSRFPALPVRAVASDFVATCPALPPGAQSGVDSTISGVARGPFCDLHLTSSNWRLGLAGCGWVAPLLPV